MQQPGLTSPQGFNAAAVAAGRFALVFQRVGRVAFAVTDSTLAEDDGDELALCILAYYSHAVIDDDAVTLVGGEHGVASASRMKSISWALRACAYTKLCIAIAPRTSPPLPINASPIVWVASMNAPASKPEVAETSTTMSFCS
uniref:Uncharacterized protein n=1 Tax=Salmonella phage vB_SE130_2P TaxID=3236707 RepID=A0AB39C4X1_9VIRU